MASAYKFLCASAAQHTRVFSVRRWLLVAPPICMASSLLAAAVSDLCIGKPAIPSLPASTSLLDVLPALKSSPSASLAVCTCSPDDHHHSSSHPPHHAAAAGGSCDFLGRLSMVDVLCFLCRAENLPNPASALDSPVSAALPVAGRSLLRRVDRRSSLLEALELLAGGSGVHNLVVPIHARGRGGAREEYCWLTQEDVARYLLNSIALFSPLPARSAASLGVVRAGVLAVDSRSPGIAAVDLVTAAHSSRTAVAVLDSPGGGLVGEIAPAALAACRDEGVAAAIAVLSAGELVAYVGGGGPPPADLARTVRGRLGKLGMSGMLQLLDEIAPAPAPDSPPSSSSSASSFSTSSSSVSSSEDEFDGEEWPSRRGSCTASRMGRTSEAIVCRKGSSLVAVMAQALAHRVGHVWVVDDDNCFAGVVTISDVLGVFRDHLRLLAETSVV